jgi:DNA polymerase III epsilon subunit-like protein
MAGEKLVCMDSETGDTDPKTGDILTLYFGILDENKNVTEELYLKLKPENREIIAQEGALKVNKINIEEHLKDPETITYKEAKARIKDFFSKNKLPGKKGSSFKLLGHNLAFDIDFINHYLFTKEEWKSMVGYRAIDTFSICSFFQDTGFWPPDLGSLVSIADFLEVSLEEAHNAKEDSIACAKVYRRMTELLDLKKAETLKMENILKALE